MNRLPLEKQQQAKSVGTPSKLPPMPTYKVEDALKRLTRGNDKLYIHLVTPQYCHLQHGGFSYLEKIASVFIFLPQQTHAARSDRNENVF